MVNSNYLWRDDFFPRQKWLFLIPFSRVCELCYRKLNLLLIAVQVSKSNGGQQLLINPGSHIKLKPGCLGFFIAESAKEVKRANVWCARCHANVSDPEDIRRCGCPHNVKVNATSHLDIHEVLLCGHPILRPDSLVIILRDFSLRAIWTWFSKF